MPPVLVNITPDVRQPLPASGLCPRQRHASQQCTINDDEPGLHEDYKRWLKSSRLGCEPVGLPPQPDRKTTAMAPENHGALVVAITDGELDFGPWEQIFYGEFDGRAPSG